MDRGGVAYHSAAERYHGQWYSSWMPFQTGTRDATSEGEREAALRLSHGGYVEGFREETI